LRRILASQKVANCRAVEHSTCATCHRSLAATIRAFTWMAQPSSLAACMYKAEQPLASTNSSNHTGKERVGTWRNVGNHGPPSHPVGFTEYLRGAHHAACRGAASVLQRTALATHRAKPWNAPTALRSSIASTSPNSCSSVRFAVVLLVRSVKRLENLW
jgi:hypothetical protein